MSDMQIGMMWREDDPKIGLAKMIEQAAAYYARKYGSMPNLCHIHPSMMPVEPIAGPVELRADRYVMPKHVWIGERAG